MHTGCQYHHNQCTDYKSFAKRQYFASVQIINQQHYNRLLRPTNIFSYCRFGVWAGEIFVWRAPPLLAPPELRPCRNRLKTLSAAVNAVQRATKILLEG